MAPPPGPYSGTSTLALVARASAFSLGLVYGTLKLKILKSFSSVSGSPCGVPLLCHHIYESKSQVSSESGSEGSSLKASNDIPISLFPWKE
ncbi:hypothetical protein Lal_00034883 [Lupinus albus]|nr:hypothetical protein Lal_00034883 [Lupinus albus]